MRVAVTGASGFVGGYVAQYLARHGHSVVSYGRRPSSESTRHLPGYRSWDIGAGPTDGDGLDAVVHCAGAVGDWGNDSWFESANVAGTAAVLEAFRKASRFIHVSTSSVYSDRTSSRLISEHSSTGECASAYGRSKAAGEALVRASNRSFIILRPHIVYGPGDTTLLPRVLEACRSGVLMVPGNGRNLVSTTHVENFSSAVQAALTSHVTGIFNISDGVDVSVHELLTTILQRAGRDVRLVYLPAAAAGAVAMCVESIWKAAGAKRRPRFTRYVVSQLSEEHTLDISLARVLLGYSPKWTYRDGPLI